MNESPCLSPLTSTFLVSFHINLQENRFANFFTVRFGATSDTDMTLSILTVSMVIFISIVALEIDIFYSVQYQEPPHYRIINAILSNVFLCLIHLM